MISICSCGGLKFCGLCIRSFVILGIVGAVITAILWRAS